MQRLLPHKDILKTCLVAVLLSTINTYFSNHPIESYMLHLKSIYHKYVFQGTECQNTKRAMVKFANCQCNMYIMCRKNILVSIANSAKLRPPFQLSDSHVAGDILADVHVDLECATWIWLGPRSLGERDSLRHSRRFLEGNLGLAGMLFCGFNLSFHPCSVFRVLNSGDCFVGVLCGLVARSFCSSVCSC